MIMLKYFLSNLFPSILPGCLMNNILLMQNLKQLFNDYINILVLFFMDDIQ